MDTLDAVATTAEGIMKHFYLHTSNMEITREVGSISNFQRTYEYYTEDSNHPINEYGKFITKDLNVCIHILIGGHYPLNHKCPWCNIPCEMQNKEFAGWGGYVDCWLECPKCHSRGPLLHVNAFFLENSRDEVTQIITSKYHCRLPWDHELNCEKCQVSKQKNLDD